MNESSNSYQLFKNLKTSDIYLSLARPIIIADDIRTPENIGSIIRLGANIGALKVIFISKSGNKFKLFKIVKTASGADKKVPWLFVDDFSSAKKNIPHDYQLISVETSAKSKSIFETKMPEKICFVIGNEVKGIRTEILTQSNKVLHIPIPGFISSLNVTHALSIALFEWLRQMK